MQGAQSAKQTDYAHLKDRHVIIAMDHDEAGLKYSKDVYDQCHLAGAGCVQFLNNQVFSDYAIQDGTMVKREQPGILEKGYDLANALIEGWTPELLSEFEHNAEMPLFVKYEELFREQNDAGVGTNADTESFKRLAALSNIQYDRVRKDEAKHLGISLPTLDKEVEKISASKHQCHE